MVKVTKGIAKRGTEESLGKVAAAIGRGITAGRMIGAKEKAGTAPKIDTERGETRDTSSAATEVAPGIGSEEASGRF